MKKVILTVASLFLLVSCGNGGSSSGGGTSTSSGTSIGPTTSSPSPTSSTSSGAPTVVKYSITWKDYNGTVLRTDEVEKGLIPVYGTSPSRASDEFYTYAFTGWTPSVVAATADATYTATYAANPIYEISATQFAEAMSFKDKNFTLTISKDDVVFEHLYHLETNELYDDYIESSYTFYTLIESVGENDFEFYQGQKSGSDPVGWWYNKARSGTYEDLVDDGSAFDRDGDLLGFFSTIAFADLTYDPANHWYTGSKTGLDFTAVFHGSRLHSFLIDNGSAVYFYDFSNYGETTLPSAGAAYSNYRQHLDPDMALFLEMAEFTHNSHANKDDFQFGCLYQKVNESTTVLEKELYYSVDVVYPYIQIDYVDQLTETEHGLFLADYAHPGNMYKYNAITTKWNVTTEPQYQFDTTSTDGGTMGVEFKRAFSIFSANTLTPEGIGVFTSFVNVEHGKVSYVAGGIQFNCTFDYNDVVDRWELISIEFSISNAGYTEHYRLGNIASGLIGGELASYPDDFE